MTRCKFLIINMGADLQCERSPCSVCAFTGECCPPPCITLVGLPQKPQTSIAGEKTTKSSSLSLCDSLGLLPKQIGLARRGPLHHLSSGRINKGGSGRCSRLEVYIQTDMSRSIKWQGSCEEPPNEFCSFWLLRCNTLCDTTFGTHSLSFQHMYHHQHHVELEDVCLHLTQLLIWCALNRRLLLIWHR